MMPSPAFINLRTFNMVETIFILRPNITAVPVTPIFENPSIILDIKSITFVIRFCPLEILV